MAAVDDDDDDYNWFATCGCDPNDPLVLHGRPDQGNPDFGVTTAQRFPPYVFSQRSGAALIHKIAALKLRWSDCHGGHLRRRTTPSLIVVCCCSQHFFIDRGAQTCRVPRPDAIHCGRCYGQRPIFPKRGRKSRGRAYREGITRREAHKRLGCVLSDE